MLERKEMMARKRKRKKAETNFHQKTVQEPGTEIEFSAKVQRPSFSRRGKVTH